MEAKYPALISRMNIDALINSAVAQVRTEPNQRSELFSQALLGEELIILEEKERWLRCRLYAGSEGWIHRGSIVSDNPSVKQFKEGPILLVWSLQTRALSAPGYGAEPIVVLTSGARLKAEDKDGLWSKVVLPDGRHAWVESAHRIPEKELPGPSGQSISSLALSLLGIPYLWGGTSTSALDCSGLTQLVFRLHGTALPRNSFDQADAGAFLDPGEGFGNLRIGDLLFFAEGPRVDHVALSLGGASLIHSSMSNGGVRVESLDPSSVNFSQRLASMFHSARRVS